MTSPDEPNGHAPGSVVVHVVHASPGRLRVKVSREALESRQLENAEQSLAAVRGVLEVRRNPAARSVLVRYDPDSASLPAMFAAVAGSGVTVAAPPAQEEDPVESGDFGGAIVAAVERADRWVTRQTHGRADLRTLLPLTLAGLAVREVLAGRIVAAPWYALAWYAFDSFYKLQRTDSPPQEPSSDPPGPDSTSPTPPQAE